MKKLILLLLKLLVIAGIVCIVVFKQDWVQTNVLNRIEGMFFVYKGDRAYQRGKLSFAIDYYQRGLTLYPKHYTAWYNLGNIFVVFEDYYAAVDAYEHAIENNKNYVVARMNLGIIQAEKLGNFDAAIEQYDTIINSKYPIWAIPLIFDNKRSSKTNRGLAYYNMGRAYSSKALYLNDSERMLSNPLLLKSADAYEHACKILKKDSEVRYNLALVYHLLGNYRDAGKSYCKAIELAPMNYEAHYNLAILLRRMKHFRESIQELEKTSLLISTNGLGTNSEYIFGILADVSHLYIDYKEDPRYQHLADTDNQDVDFYEEEHKKDKVKENKENKKKAEELNTFIDEKGKVRASKDLDNSILENMSHCEGWVYFKD